MVQFGGGGTAFEEKKGNTPTANGGGGDFRALFFETKKNEYLLAWREGLGIASFVDGVKDEGCVCHWGSRS